MLEDFYHTGKIPTASAGIEPRELGVPEGSMLTTRPPKPPYQVFAKESFKICAAFYTHMSIGTLSNNS
jgi:hypothetical protein